MTKKALFLPSFLQSEMLAADSQMTTGFFTLQPVNGWETNHSHMTTGFFILQSWILDAQFRGSCLVDH